MVKPNSTDNAQRIELQGHRGARGLAPENTLAGFATTLGIGVHGIEVDVGMTSDGYLILYHDLWLNPDITRDANGQWLDSRGPSIHSLTLEQLRQFDVGRIKPDTDYANRFAQQVAVDGEGIPLLREFVELCNRSGHNTLNFNIEIKLEPGHADASASPRRFAAAIVREIDELGIADRCVVQSFWWDVPREVSKLRSDIRTSCLSSEQSWGDTIGRHGNAVSPWTGYDIREFDGSVPHMAHAAGASVWAPWHEELTARNVADAKELGLDIITWTVNDKKSMLRLIDIGVSGIISDYPDRLVSVARSAGLQVPPVF